MHSQHLGFQKNSPKIRGVTQCASTHLFPREYVMSHTSNKDFKSAFMQVQQGQKGGFLEYDSLLYKRALLCKTNNGNMLHGMGKIHTSKVAGHFQIGKTLLNISFGTRCMMTLPGMFEVATCVVQAIKQKRGLYLLLPCYVVLGKEFLRITYMGCHQPGPCIITCLLWLTISVRR